MYKVLKEMGRNHLQHQVAKKSAMYKYAYKRAVFQFIAPALTESLIIIFQLANKNYDVIKKNTCYLQALSVTPLSANVIGTLGADNLTGSSPLR